MCGKTEKLSVFLNTRMYDFGIIVIFDYAFGCFILPVSDRDKSVRRRTVTAVFYSAVSLAVLIYAAA